MKRHLSPLDKQRWLAREFSFWEKLSLAIAAFFHPSLHAELKALQRQQEAFASHPKRRLELESLQQRFGTQPLPMRRQRHYPWMFVMPVTAFAAFLVIYPSSITRKTDEHASDLIAKGNSSSSLTVFADTNGDIRAAPKTCRAGDRLRARYRSRFPYLMIVGVDSTQNLEIWFPLGGAQSVHIEKQGTTPGSWILDDAPGEQHIVALFTSTALDAKDVMRVFSKRHQLNDLEPMANEVVAFSCVKAR